MQQNKWRWQVEGAREIIVVMAAVAFFSVLDFGMEKRGYAVVMAAPLRAIATPITNFVGNHQRTIRPLTRWFRVMEQNRRLTSMLAQTEGELVALQGVQQENMQLRQLLENRHLDLQERRVGRTVASYASPSIWLGKTTDVKPGSLVLHKGVLLGRISRISGGIAEVELLAEPSSFSALVRVGSDTRAVGVTKSERGQLVVSNLPSDVAVEPNQSVVTVGQVGVQPDLFVGMTTSNVEYQQGEGRVVVDQLVSFFETTAVEILPIDL